MSSYTTYIGMFFSFLGHYHTFWYLKTKVHTVEIEALVVDCIDGLCDVDLWLTTHTAEKHINLTDVWMLVATCFKELICESLHTFITLHCIKTELWWVDIARLLIAALELAELFAVARFAVLHAVA